MKFFKILILVAAFCYLFWEIDITLMMNASERIFWNGILLGATVLFGSMFVAAIRWKHLSKKALGIRESLESVVVCLGVNNITPMKLGEIAKTFYLRELYKFPISRSFPMMFIERFFDILILALLLSIVSYYFDIDTLVIIVLVTICGFLLYFASNHPKMIISRLPGFVTGRIKKFFIRSLITLARISMVEWWKIFLISGFLWVLYYLFFYVLILKGTDIIIDPFEVLIVLVAAQVGMSIPSSPGGIGVVEASIIFALSSFGVDKEIALSFALIQRMIQYVPVTLAMLAIFSVKKFNLKIIKSLNEK